jgi:hypothetical protein
LCLSEVLSCNYLEGPTEKIEYPNQDSQWSSKFLNQVCVQLIPFDLCVEMFVLETGDGSQGVKNRECRLVRNRRRQIDSASTESMDLGNMPPPDLANRPVGRRPALHECNECGNKLVIEMVVIGLTQKTVVC